MGLDNETPPDPFEMADMFIWAFRNSEKYKMHFEFVQFMLQDLGVTKERLNAAINYANREWDL